MLLLIIIVLVLAAGGFFGGNAFRPGYGPGVSLGTVLVVLLLLYLFGVFGRLR